MKSFRKRADIAQHPVGKKLFNLMADKETNLAVSADVTSTESLLTLCKAIATDVCIVKTHMDILKDFSRDAMLSLRQLADKEGFLIFEDRKFADIGNTVKLQVQNPHCALSDWADMVTVHALPGPGIIQGIHHAAPSLGQLLLAQMSSAENLLDKAYTEKAIAMAKANPEAVFGFIAQEKLIDDPGFVHLTPGVKLQTAKDNLGQQYLTPEIVIKEKQSDIVIVGRGIYEADDPKATSAAYRKAAWNAYQTQ